MLGGLGSHSDRRKTTDCTDCTYQAVTALPTPFYFLPLALQRLH